MTKRSRKSSSIVKTSANTKDVTTFWIFYLCFKFLFHSPLQVDVGHKHGKQRGSLVQIRFFMRNPSATTSNASFVSRSRQQKCQKRETVRSYREISGYVFEMYATHSVVKEMNTDKSHCMQPLKNHYCKMPSPVEQRYSVLPCLQRKCIEIIFLGGLSRPTCKRMRSFLYWLRIKQSFTGFCASCYSDTEAVVLYELNQSTLH